MRCDVCDQEVANSEELQAHKEREHPVKKDDDGGAAMPQSEDQEQPEPVFRPVR